MRIEWLVFIGVLLFVGYQWAQQQSNLSIRHLLQKILLILGGLCWIVLLARAGPIGMVLGIALITPFIGYWWPSPTTYRSRNQEKNHRDQAHSSSHMSDTEAYAILGLSPGATSDEIKAAHRRLIVRLHPDHGGSNYLASQINRARHVLLKE